MMADGLGRMAHDYMVLFAMVNALGNLPLLAEATRDMDRPTRGRVFRVAVLTAGSLVISFALLGDWMLQSVFQVDTDAFKVAGGLLVFAVAARGVLSGPVPGGLPEGRRPLEVAVFPLGFPLLAGPGTIVTTILLRQQDGGLDAALVAAAVYLTVLPLLYLAPLVEKAVGRAGALVVTRLLYIFIAAKATSFVVQGLRALVSAPS